MKKIISILVLSILVFYILLFPGEAIQAASKGLMLWYNKILPTLLPFAIISYIFITTGILNGLAGVVHKIIHKILPVSKDGIYPFIAGFLFGFPMGSRIAALLVEQRQMDYQEGNRLFAITNNISPVFISGFILTTSLHRPELQAVTLFILYLPPIVYFILDSHLHSNKNESVPQMVIFSGHQNNLSTKKAAPRSQINFKIIDAGIMSGFETLTKLGGYIMLFAIFSQITTHIPTTSTILLCLITGLTEITNGIACISDSSLPFETKYLLIILCTAFGGLSGLAQTASMVKDAGFQMWDYIKTKLICSLASVILALFAIKLLF